MSDFHLVLPHFSFTPGQVPVNVLFELLHSCPLPTADLITTPVTELVLVLKAPAPVVAELVSQITEALRLDCAALSSCPLSSSASTAVPTALPDCSSRGSPLQPGFISTLDRKLDDVLGGGFPTHHISELVAPAGCGKTQLLYSLLLGVQLHPPHGLSRAAVYISTEAPLSVVRLHQIAQHVNNHRADDKVSLDRVFSYHTTDPEDQNHVLRHQLPRLIDQHNVGLVVIDSIAPNLLADVNPFDFTAKKRALLPAGVHHPKQSRGQMLGDRRVQVVRTGAWLRRLAVGKAVAVVVANQVSDRFDYDSFKRDATPLSFPVSSSFPRSDHHVQSSPFTASSTGFSNTPTADANFGLTSRHPMTLDHQHLFYSGWGSSQSAKSTDLKTPTLGLAWTNEISARIMLSRTELFSARPSESADTAVGSADDHCADDYRPVFDVKFERRLRVVFAPWAHQHDPDADTVYEIWEGGVRAAG